MDVSTEHLKFADIYPDLAKKYAQKLHIKKDEIPFIRKFYSSEKSEPVKKERAIISYITTNLKDRDGEVLLPEGMLTENYEKSGRPVFWGHSYGDPKNVVGQNMWLKPDKDGTGIIAKTAFRKNQFADEVYQLFTEDIAGIGPALKSWSVGFIPIKWADGDTKDADAPRKTYQEWELLEYSAVPIASNPGAISLAYQKGMITTKRLKKDLETELEVEVEDFQEEVEVETEVKTMTPDELKEHYRGLQEVEVISDESGDWHDPGLVLEVEKDIVTKPETTDDYHRIPVSTGHEGHKIRTMTVSAKKGIKALYCVDCKKIKTYLFDTSKWSMEEAQAWVDSHKGLLERVESRETGRDEDEADLQDTVNDLIEEGVEDVEDLAFSDVEDLAFDVVEEKRFDLEGNPSVWDIMDAIRLSVQTPVNSKTYRYVADLYPTKYPSGLVVIEETKEKEKRKYLLHSYEYDSGTVKLGESKELEATYQPKERNFLPEQYEIRLHERKEFYEKHLQSKEEFIIELKEIIAELKEGRVLSRKNREVVKNAVTALMDVLKADSTGSLEDEDKEEVEDEKEVEIEIERGEYSAEEIQAMMDGALKKALANIDIGKAVDLSVKKLKGKVE